MVRNRVGLVLLGVLIGAVLMFSALSFKDRIFRTDPASRQFSEPVVNRTECRYGVFDYNGPYPFEGGLQTDSYGNPVIDESGSGKVFSGHIIENSKDHFSVSVDPRTSYTYIYDQPYTIYMIEGSPVQKANLTKGSCFEALIWNSQSETNAILNIRVLFNPASRQ